MFVEALARSMFGICCNVSGSPCALPSVAHRRWFPVMCCPLIFCALVYLWFAKSEL